MTRTISDKACDTLIVGGGIIGLSLAYELSARGQRVTVVERNECSRAASWAGVGILPPVATREIHDPLEQLRSLSHSLLEQWSHQLKATTGIDNGWRNCGGLYIATTVGESATLVASERWWDELGVTTQAWDSITLAHHQPAMKSLADSGRVRACRWLPGECQIRPPWHTRALRAACESQSVRILENTEVVDFETQVGRIQAVHTNRDRLVADNFCISAGPWTRQLLEPLEMTSGVLPIRGQVLLYRVPDPSRLTCIVNEGNRYLVPREDGFILVGSNEEETGFVCETTPQVLEELHQWALGMMPELSCATIEKSWAGLRPASFDSYPYIGRLPDYKNAFVASGHFRAGIHLSAGTAKVLSDSILGLPKSIDLDPFRPGRG